MSASQNIRQALSEVATGREAMLGNAGLREAFFAVKRFQCARFASTYQHMAGDACKAPALQFFLNDLYAPRDFAQRDAQFGRIAGAIERVFPAEVAQTAATLAQVHALSERLDAELAGAWLQLNTQLTPGSYITAWRTVGQPTERHRQLQTVLNLGRQLDKHTRTTGLRTLLKIMRGPATAAGLSDLQGFLERGFDTFKGLRGAGPFLTEIESTESRFIQACFLGPVDEAVALFAA